MDKLTRIIIITYYKILNHFGINKKCVRCGNNDTDGYYICGECERELFQIWADGFLDNHPPCEFNEYYECSNPERSYNFQCGVEAFGECSKYMDFHKYIFSNEGFSFVLS